jgi:ABC-type phosphate transport system substrate-binding protein
MPIAQAAAKAYESDCAGATIHVAGGDSAFGLTQVRQAVASRSKSSGSMISMYDGTSTDATGLTGHPVGALIYSIVAYTGLFPTLNTSTERLRRIFISPGEQGIVAVGRRAGSGSRQAFDTAILGSNPGAPSTRNCPKPNGRPASFTSCTEDSTEDLLNFINGTPNAIGYAQISGSSNNYPNVSVLSIDNAAPTRDNVANGSYRYWIIEHLYASPNPTALARDFLDFLSSYNASNLPPDYVSCLVAVNTLGAAC